jgi:hypothetical protein
MIIFSRAAALIELPAESSGFGNEKTARSGYLKNSTGYNTLGFDRKSAAHAEPSRAEELNDFIVEDLQSARRARRISDARN